MSPGNSILIVCNICLQSRATIFNNFIPGNLVSMLQNLHKNWCHQQLFALKLCGQPEDRKEREWKGEKGWKQTARAALPFCGLAAFLRRADRSKHMAGEGRHEAPSASPPLQALNKQAQVVEL